MSIFQRVSRRKAMWYTSAFYKFPDKQYETGATVISVKNCYAQLSRIAILLTRRNFVLFWRIYMIKCQCYGCAGAPFCAADWRMNARPMVTRHFARFKVFWHGTFNMEIDGGCNLYSKSKNTVTICCKLKKILLWMVELKVTGLQ